MITETQAILFDLQGHPLRDSLCEGLRASVGEFNSRKFPDGETYLQIGSEVKNRHCMVLCELSDPDPKYLPLCFLAATLRELGASSVGLIAPYLSYMRQDRRFMEGEAITSRIFAKLVSEEFDWLVTVDPHLHRYHSLGEIYSIPSRVIQGAPALAAWLGLKSDLLLVGPDSESEQWVANIASICGHPFVIGEKTRTGDRSVSIQLPKLDKYAGKIAIVIDDVISSGQTILECLRALQAGGIDRVKCACIHGIFADGSDSMLLESGLAELISTNSISHSSNAIDITHLFIPAISGIINAYE